MRKLLVTCLIGLSIGFYVGCEADEEEASKEEQICQKIWDCGMMTSGYSVQDCTDIITSCTNQLLTSEKTDWNNAANGCLGLANCQNFGDCYWDIDVCELTGDGGGGGDSDSGDDGGDCADTGEECEANGDCCNYPESDLCVNFGDYGIHCAAMCETNADCASNCCLPLEEGGSVCGPPELCEG